MKKDRIAFLDGYRGLAILLVIFFHAFSRWNDILPYKHDYSNVFLFKYGFLGVQLFFMLSGFVILMTLERTQNFIEFSKKRWLRLIPAMIVASIIIFATGNILPNRPNGIPNFSWFIPGLLFIDPAYLNYIFDTDLRSLDGSFWSLYVEVKFYIIFGLLFYTVKLNKALLGIILIYLVFLLSLLLTGGGHIITRSLSIFAARDMGWFSVGALAYLYFKRNDYKFLSATLLMGALACLQYYSDIKTLLVAIIILIVFIAPLVFHKLQIIFTYRIFLFLGFISYPLYLIHQFLMVALINKYSSSLSFMHDLLLPIPAFIILSSTAYLISKFIEPFIKTELTKILSANQLKQFAKKTQPETVKK